MAATDIDFPIPEGYNPPFAVITDHDHSAYLIIACALGIALVSLSIVIHVFLRTAFGHGFGWDDTVLFLATVSRPNDTRRLHYLTDPLHLQAVAFVQSSVTWTAAVHGLGASITLLTPTQLETVQEVSSPAFTVDNLLTLPDLLRLSCPYHCRTRSHQMLRGAVHSTPYSLSRPQNTCLDHHGPRRCLDVFFCARDVSAV